MEMRLYQINTNRDPDRMCFLNYTATQALGGIDAAKYDLTYNGDIACSDVEEIYTIFNSDRRPQDFMGRSLSVSDVVELHQNGESEFFFCDSVGFQKIDNFNPDDATIKYKEMLEVVILEPGRPAYIGLIGNTLQDMQKFVEGYIEVSYPFGDKQACIISNDEGKLLGLLPNRALRLNMADKSESDKMYDFIAGKAFICGLTEDSFCSLSKSDLQEFKQQFFQPEIFYRTAQGIESQKVEPPTISRTMRHT